MPIICQPKKAILGMLYQPCIGHKLEMIVPFIGTIQILVRCKSVNQGILGHFNFLQQGSDVIVVTIHRDNPPDTLGTSPAAKP